MASLGTPDDIEELESTTATPGSGSDEIMGSDVSTTASSSSTSRLDRVLAQLAELKVSKELEKKTHDLEKPSPCVVVDLSDDDDGDFENHCEHSVAEPPKPSSGATPTGMTRSQRIANLLLESKQKRLANGTNKDHKDTNDAVTSVPGTSTAVKAPKESVDEKCQNPYVLPNYVPLSLNAGFFGLFFGLNDPNRIAKNHSIKGLDKRLVI